MKTSFIEILSKNSIVIPIIQRDYAQGRTDVKTNKIRKDFMDAIFEVLHDRVHNGSKHKLELDFIYGFDTKVEGKTIFAPIDGQQRLTTLWLLLWYISVRESILDKEKELLKNFKYETRHSTSVFCGQLVKFVPKFNCQSIDLEIKNQPWYFDSWDFDPSIKAMLVMLNDIEKRYLDLNHKEIWKIFNHQQNPFYFYKLEMEKVGLPDDLYIKMNSRGKPLTEFEYFKASFLEIIKNEDLKKRFENSIDQQWTECIWTIVLEKIKNRNDIDVALLVDDCFIRFINFISDVLAYKQGLTFVEINHSIEETKGIYQNDDNLIFLFDILDSIVELQDSNSDFWSSLFYIAKDEFIPEKSRLFFQNSQVNLLEKCLFHYDRFEKGFSYPEQLLLFACITHLLHKTVNFKKAARVIRNLVANSSNELRENIIGQSFSEVESFVRNCEFEILDHFKSDQINEEKEKHDFILSNRDKESIIYELEDSDIFRGCISIFDLDDHFPNRAKEFLKLFDENIVISDFVNRSNLLLCFGDYSQADGDHTNLLSRKKENWRTFFTTPAYNKQQLNSQTKPTLMYCLDYFIENPEISIENKLNERLNEYNKIGKDWRYYFLKYSNFRANCNKGYYYWYEASDNIFYKMKEKQFNGYHWDAHLMEIKEIIDDQSLQLNIGNEMILNIENDIISIASIPNGFQFISKNESDIDNPTLNKLIEDGILDIEGNLQVEQNIYGTDIDDRIEICSNVIKRIVELKNGNMQKAKFKNIDEDVFEVLVKFFKKLKLKSTGYEPARHVGTTLADLENFPELSTRNMAVSFKFEDTTFYIVYSDYKIELSDYFRDGGESYQRFCFKFEIEGHSEMEGDIQEFSYLLFDCLDNVNLKEISFSDEE